MNVIDPFLFTDSAFKQQRLPAWQPILTAGTVLPTFFVIGIAFIPVGIGLLYFSDEVKEIIIDYTHCKEVQYRESELNPNSYTELPHECSQVIHKNHSVECKCRIPFTLDTDYAVRNLICKIGFFENRNFRTIKIIFWAPYNKSDG